MSSNFLTADDAREAQEKAARRLVKAIAAGDASAVRVALLKGARLNEALSGGPTPIWLAMKGKSEDVVLELLRGQPGVPEKSKDGTPVLLAAVSRGWKRASEMLIGAGANLMESDEAGVTPLQMAAKKNNWRVGEALAKHWAKAVVGMKSEWLDVPLNVAGEVQAVIAQGKKHQSDEFLARWTAFLQVATSANLRAPGWEEPTRQEWENMPIEAYVLDGANNTIGVQKVISKNLKAWESIISGASVSLLAKGGGSGPIMDLASVEMAEEQKVVLQTALEGQTPEKLLKKEKLDVPMDRLGEITNRLVIWADLVGMGDSKAASACKAWIDECFSKSAWESETETLARWRPIQDRWAGCSAKEMLNNLFASKEDRDRANVAGLAKSVMAIGDAAKEMAKKERSAFEKRIRDLVTQGALPKEKEEEALRLLGEATEDFEERKDALAKVWVSRKIIQMDRELISELEQMPFPKDEDGKGLLSEALRRIPCQGLMLVYFGKNPTAMMGDATTVCSIGVENEATGTTVSIVFQNNPITLESLALKMKVGPGFSEEDVLAVVRKGLDIHAKKGAFKKKMREWLGAPPERVHGYGMPQGEEGIEAMGKQCLLALKTLAYVCCSNAQIKREAPIERSASPFSDLAKKKAEELMAPEDASAGWDSLWLGVKFGDLKRRLREEGAQSPEGKEKRRVAPHARSAHWHHVWVGPKDKARRLELRWYHALIVGAKEEADVENLKPTGMRLQ